jgi:hypothetical protein
MGFGEDDCTGDAGRRTEGMKKPAYDRQSVAMAGIDAVGFQRSGIG